MKSELLMLFV